MAKGNFTFRKLKTLLPTLILGVFATFYAEPAYAHHTLGDVVLAFVDSLATVPGLIVALAYLFGLYLGISGILKLKEHVESPNQVPFWDPMKRFIAGGAFFALPSVYNAVIGSLTGGTAVTGYLTNVSGNNYRTGGVSSTGLDAMLVRLVVDFWQPMQYLFIMFGYIMGLILLFIGISRLLKTEQEGPRGPIGIGTLVTFLVAGVLFSQAEMLGTLMESLFDHPVQNNAVLSYGTTIGMSAQSQGHAEAVVAAIMAFVAILGWISFIRGFFIMRGVAEGNSQASAMAGLTHIIGGALAVNLGSVIVGIQRTLGITQYGLTISDATPYIQQLTSFA